MTRDIVFVLLKQPNVRYDTPSPMHIGSLLTSILAIFTHTSCCSLSCSISATEVSSLLYSTLKISCIDIQHHHLYQDPNDEDRDTSAFSFSIPDIMAAIFKHKALQEQSDRKSKQDLAAELEVLSIVQARRAIRQNRAGPQTDSNSFLVGNTLLCDIHFTMYHSMLIKNQSQNSPSFATIKSHNAGEWKMGMEIQ